MYCVQNRFTKNPENMPRVVFNEKSKTGLGFGIRLPQQKMLAYAHCVTMGDAAVAQPCLECFYD